MHRNPSDTEIKALLTSARTIAIVGASSNPIKPSHGVMKRLLSVGYRVIPVNPREEEVHGQRAFASLSDVGESIDIVDVFRRPEFTPSIADEAVAVGAGALWLQLGIHNDKAAARAKAGGLTVVTDMCIAVAYGLLGVAAKQ
jgi:predicted CoA-binding protein